MPDLHLVAPNQRRLNCVIHWFERILMYLKSAAALCFGLVILGLAAPAQAQNRVRVAPDGTRYTVVDENGRARTKIVVQQRSFLDGGTEILPGTLPSTNNVMPFGYSPM